MGRRSWFRLHSWVGVVSGLLLFVVCWSGTVATLSHEIDWLLTSERRVTPTGDRLSLEALHDIVQASHAAATIQSVAAPLNARAAAVVVIKSPDQRAFRLYVDPYNGLGIGTSSGFDVHRFFRDFHQSLFVSPWGDYLVYALGPVFFVSTAAPLIFYRRWWQRFFTLKMNRGRRVLWSDAHKLVGLWGIWFAWVIGITGAWYLFEATREDFGDGKGVWVAPSAFAHRSLPALTTHRTNPTLSVGKLIQHARQARPDLDIRNASWDSGYFYVDGQSDHWLVRDRANKLYLDPRDGAVVFNQHASDQPLYWRWSDTADPLHFGDFGGLTSKLIWFVFGLGLSGLCLTGAWLHAQRLAQEAGGRERARWAGTGAALAATLLVLAASVKGGWDEIKGFGPVVNGVQHWPEVPWAVTAFIAGWVVLTLAIIAWWVSLFWRAPARRAEPARGDHGAQPHATSDVSARGQ